MAQIIDFFSKKKLIEERSTALEKKTEKPAISFKTISSKNAENKERLRKERDQANKNVMKSYRIK